jgi:hypothetical protein
MSTPCLTVNRAINVTVTGGEWVASVTLVGDYDAQPTTVCSLLL